MIDTVLLSTDLELERNPGNFTEHIIRSPREGTREKWTRNDLPVRYTYYPGSKKLFLECSLPHIFHDNNYTMLQQGDLQSTGEKVIDITQEALHMSDLDHLEKWGVHKVDLCFNFQVKELVTEYLAYFQKLHIPYKGACISFQEETVTWKGKSKGLKFYDKEKESEAIEAKGILRMELRIQHQGTFRDLLGFKKKKRRKLKAMDDPRESNPKNYYWWQDGKEEEEVPWITFEQVMNTELIRKELNRHLDVVFPVNEEIFFDDIGEFFPLLYEEFSLDKALRYVGALHVANTGSFGVSRLKNNLPKSTYYRINSELKKLNIHLVQRDKKLKPLKIEKGEL